MEIAHESSVRRIAWVGLLAALCAPSGCNDRPSVPIFGSGPGVRSPWRFRQQKVDKIDLLFVIDNSTSMADKQLLLARELPALIRKLTIPEIDAKTGRPRYATVTDLHVGFITSSLGSHGTSTCDPSVNNKHNHDHGHLLPREGEESACSGTVASTALRWVFDPKRDPTAFSGIEGSGAMQTSALCLLTSAKEDGCGYEETWEAAYHFLIDPAPYASADVKCTFGVSGDACGNNKIEVKGIDTELLAQRSAFLRKDSLLAVVILSDENDVSLKPASLNWLPWGYLHMERGWAACDKVPDDFEPETGSEYVDLHTKYGCFSCLESPSDPNCKVPWPTEKLNDDVDGRNLRGFHMVQRFGYNFLWSRQRYVDGFSKSVAIGSDGKPGANPIFAGGFRSTDMIIVGGIVGVPRQLLDESTGAPKGGVAGWPKIVGPPDVRDPHMIESIAPRTDKGIKKFAGDRSIDEISGGDRDIMDGDDLQYACIAKRATSEVTSECTGGNPELRSPLCDAGGKQTFFKAYPGLRHLRILKELGASGYVASICDDSYERAMSGFFDKLQAALASQCLEPVIDQDAVTKNVPCVLLESFADATLVGKTRCEDIAKGYCTPGAAPCRLKGTDYPPITPEEAAAQLSLRITYEDEAGLALDTTPSQAFTEGGNVYVQSKVSGPGGKTQVKHLVCEVVQLTSGRVPQAETDACFSDPSYGEKTPPSIGGGWCYSTDPVIVGDACRKAGAPGKIRWLGDVAPKTGSETFTFCVAGAR